LPVNRDAQSPANDAGDAIEQHKFAAMTMNTFQFMTLL